MDAGLDAVKTASKKAGEFLGNKIADAITKSKDNKIVKQKYVEQTIIPPEKKRWIIKQFEEIIIKTEKYKIPKLLNDSSVSNIVTKKGSK